MYGSLGGSIPPHPTKLIKCKIIWNKGLAMKVNKIAHYRYIEIRQFYDDVKSNQPLQDDDSIDSYLKFGKYRYDK